MDNSADKSDSILSTALVGRQSIYDKKLDVYGYELLYRHASEVNKAPSEFDGKKATSRVMMNTFMEIGLENIVNDKKAFINLTDEFIHGELLVPLPNDSVVLEILENTKITPEILEGLGNLKSKKYKIALDDFTFEPSMMKLVEYANIIKVDLPNVNKDTLEKEIGNLKNDHDKLIFLAEKIETQEEFEFCKSLGFDLFQGYFLEKPTIVKGSTLPPNKLAVLQLVSRLQDPYIEVDEVEQHVKQDASLSFKLLKYINSPAFNLESKVININQAVMLLGLATLKRWVTLIVISGLSDKSSDLIRKALMRAKMCELLADTVKKAKTVDCDYFLMGLFSLLDVMLDQSMEDILKEIPINDETKNAILHYKGIPGKILHCVMDYQEGKWDDLSCGRLNTLILTESFIETVHWTEKAVNGLSDD